MYIHTCTCQCTPVLVILHVYMCMCIYIPACMYRMCTVPGTPVFPSNKFLKFEIEIFSNFFSKY